MIWQWIRELCTAAKNSNSNSHLQLVLVLLLFPSSVGLRSTVSCEIKTDALNLNIWMAPWWDGCIITSPSMLAYGTCLKNLKFTSKRCFSDGFCHFMSFWSPDVCSRSFLASLWFQSVIDVRKRGGDIILFCREVCVCVLKFVSWRMKWGEIRPFYKYTFNSGMSQGGSVLMASPSSFFISLK